MSKLLVSNNNNEGCCKGIVYRCNRSTYISSDGSINYKESFKKLKRKSCNGCSECYWVEEDLLELITYAPEHVWIDNDVHHGCLCSVRVVDQNVDWESGIVDDYSLEFYKVGD